MTLICTHFQKTPLSRNHRGPNRMFAAVPAVEGALSAAARATVHENAADVCGGKIMDSYVHVR